MSKNEEIKAPRNLSIGEYKYSYKGQLVNAFTYRCKHRRKCGVVIKIAKDELKKYISKCSYNI